MGLYAQNGGAVCNLKYHLGWCPKYPRPVLIKPVDWLQALLLQQKAKELEITIHSLAIVPDHVDLFVEAEPTVNRLKGSTSHVVGTEFVSLRPCLPTLWSYRYYAGTVGQASAAAVRHAIEGEKRK